MKMCKLMTIRPHRYGTRHLTAGEEYEVPVRQAVALVVSKKARFADKPMRAAKVAEPLVADSDDSIAGAAIADFVEYMKPQTIIGQIGGDEQPEVTIDSLRMEATQLGINVDGRWGLARLQHEIEQTKPPIEVEGRR